MTADDSETKRDPFAAATLSEFCEVAGLYFPLAPGDQVSCRTQRTLGTTRSQAPAVVVDVQAAGQPIVWCNDAFVQLTGYSRRVRSVWWCACALTVRNQELYGRNCSLLQGPDTLVGGARSCGQRPVLATRTVCIGRSPIGR